ncbi:hypothetical protein MTP99_011987 [Tenebrio molitor]|jgi:transmembrane protein 216|uniref:transmembrane protein 216-like n=1 Tax=Tenebrio molitor TaxID=7067 RepID=UPI001C3A8C9A|nr:hypothetical protein MTP99_011987 [Tenebrio molitor]CAH1370408.1 unnamed protein product [Tenebrio molitor]
MKVDAELMFECLIYLNVFYYPLFFICETILVAAKWQSAVPTPGIDQDASVIFTVLGVEIAKILIYRKFKERKRDLVTGLAVIMTFITIAGCLYTFFLQDFVARLEYILCAMMTLLALTEVAFGFLQILPCFKKVQYY